MAEIMQHKARQNYMYEDQHGRQWLAIVDTRTKPYLAPCVQPWPQFTAPVLPAGTLLEPDPSKLGRLNVNYAKWLDDAQAQERTYLDTLQQTAEKMFGDNATRAIAERDPRLGAAMGPAPISPLFIRAAASGNKWVLGLVSADEVPSWAEPLLDTLPQYRPTLSATYGGTTEFPDRADEVAAPAGDDAEPPKRTRKGAA